MLFALMPYGKAQAQAYCTVNTLQETCYSSDTLYSTTFVPWVYHWYECDASGNNLVIQNGGSPVPNYLVINPHQATHNETRYYVEVGNRPVMPFLSCTSSVVTVKYDYELDFSISGSTLTVAPYSGLNTYSNYQWYRNGMAITGATGSSYITTLPGTYTLNANASNCGNRTSIAHTVGCGSITYSNQSISGTLSYMTVVLDGTITIDADNTLNISNCNVYMTPGSEIIVKAASGGGHYGGNLQISYSNVMGCGKWGGIFAEGGTGNVAVHNISSAQVTLSHSEIHDAYIGLFADNNAILAVDYTLFENNFRHIDLRKFDGSVRGCQILGNHGAFGNAFDFTNNTFNYLMEIPPSFNPTNLPSTPKNNNYRKQIYIDYGNTIKLSNSTFNGYSWNGKDQNAVEVYTVDGTLCDVKGFEIDGCTFNGDFNDAIMFTDATDVDIMYNDISGNVNHGIEVINGGGVDNGVDIEYNTIYNTSSTHGGISGVNISQVTNFQFWGNDVQHFVKGLEYYNLAGQACVSASPPCSTIINSNKFKYNQYGIVLAPEEDPIGTTVHNQSGITVNQMTHTSIFCNILYYNDYGIVGYGEINNLPFTNSGMASWANKFAPRTTNSSATSTSTYADIVYLWSGVAALKPKIKHFSGPQVTLNITYYTAPLKYTNNFSLDIEGVPVDQSNITNQINPTGGSHDGCWTSFNKTDPMGFGSNLEKEEGLNFSPNPFSDLLTVENPYNEPINYMIYNTLGEMVRQGTLKASATDTLGMEGLASGCYYLKTYNTANGFHIYTSKLIKTN